MKNLNKIKLFCNKKGYEILELEPKSFQLNQSTPDIIYKEKNSDQLSWIEETEIDFTLEYKNKKELTKGNNISIPIYKNPDKLLFENALKII